MSVTQTSTRASPVTAPAPGSAARFVRVPLARIRGFATRYGWLMRDALADCKRRLVMITLVSWLGAMAQGSTIACLMAFVHLLNSDTGDDPGWARRIALTPPAALVVLAGSMFGLQMFSALAGYYSAAQCRALGRRYHERAVLRVFAGVGRMPFVDMPAFKQGDFSRLIFGSTRITGVLVQTIAGSIHPIIYSIILLGIVASLNLGVTLILVPAFLLMLPTFYVLSGRIQRTAKDYFGDAATDMAVQLNTYIGHFLDSNTLSDDSAQRVRRLCADDPKLSGYLDVYDNIILSSHQSVLLLGAFKPVFLVLALLLLGYPVLGEPVSWAPITAYIVALFQLLNMSQRLASNLAIYSKLYPHLIDYHAFRTRCDGQAPEPGGAAVPATLVVRSSGAVEGGDDRAALQRGDRAALVIDRPLNRVSLPARIRPLVKACNVPHAAWGSARFVASGFRCGPGPLLSTMCGTGGVSPEREARARGMLAGLGLDGEVAALPQGLSSEVTADVWQEMSPELRAAVGAVALAMSPADIAFLDVALLARVRQPLATALLDLADDRFLFVYGPASRFRWPVAGRFLVVESNAIAGIGGWEWFETCVDREAAEVDAREALLDDPVNLI